jgi:hypothetical protein
LPKLALLCVHLVNSERRWPELLLTIQGDTPKSLHLVESHPCHSGYIVETSRSPRRVANYFRRRIDMDNDDNVGGYAVPVDPMDLLQCDSCQ